MDSANDSKEVLKLKSCSQINVKAIFSILDLGVGVHL